MNAEMPDFSVPHEEIFEVASAMAIRSLARDDLMPRIAQELSPTANFDVSPESQQQRVVGRTALYLACLSAPSERVNLKEYVEGLPIDGDTILQGMGALCEQAAPLLKDVNTKDILQSVTKELLESVGESPELPSIEGELEAAQALAQQHDTTLAEIYRSDALYLELRRVIQRPEALIEVAQNGLETNSLATYVKALPAMMRVLQPNAEQEFGEEQARQFLEAVEENPSLKAFFDGMIENSKEVLRQHFACEMIAIWGFSRYQEALRENDHLRPKQDLTQTVMGILYPKAD